eukprot:5281312-Pyramimonas_sp.AAC.1
MLRAGRAAHVMYDSSAHACARIATRFAEADKCLADGSDELLQVGLHATLGHFKATLRPL